MFLKRVTLLLGAVAITVQATAFAWPVLALGAKAGKEKAEQEFRRFVPVIAPAFTERPTRVYRGTNPARDPQRNNWWTSSLRRDLDRLEMQEAIERGDVYAALRPMLPALLQAGGSGGAGAGGGGGGEGSGSGGGSGAGGGAGGGAGEGGGPSGGGGGGAGIGGLGGETNTNTGNKLSTLGIVSWGAVGESGVSFRLFHSSIGDYQRDLGYGWSHSYDVKVTHTPGSSAILRMPDGLLVPYAEVSGAFDPPSGWQHGLVKNANGTFTLTFTNQSKWEFNAAGWLTAKKDRVGNTTTVNRNANDKITTVTSPDGRALTFAYDGSGRITSVTDPLSRVWTFTHNAAGDTTGVSYPALSGVTKTRTFTYNAQHNILTETDLDGHVWTWTYDSSERMTSYVSPLGHTTGYAYTTSSTTITLPGGQTVVHNYSSGLLASEVDAAGFSTAYTYDAERNPLTVTDARGKVWTYTYDAKGNTLTSKNPLNQTTTYTYNATNDLLTVTTPLGHVTTVNYNAQGRVTSVVDPLGRTTATATYNAFGDLTAVADALGRTTTFNYNANGDATSSLSPAGVTSSATYDALGNMLSTTDAGLLHTAVFRDEWNRITTTQLPGNANVNVTYNGRSLVTAIVDPLGRVTTTQYDALGRQSVVTNAKGESQSYTYDVNGRVSTFTKPKGGQRSYSYSARGDLTSVTKPDGSVHQYSYLATGEPSLYTSPLGHSIATVYDDAGQATLVDYPSGVDTSYSFDSSGRLTSIVDASGTTSVTYNAAGEITQYVTPQGTHQRTYNAAGQLTSTTDVGIGTTTYAYDSAGRIQSTTDAWNETTSITYDALGRVQRRTLSTGVYDQLGYDSRSRVVSITTAETSGTPIRTRTFSYDIINQVISSSVNGVATNYNYDLVGQLTSEVRAGFSAQYAYDANGNRLSKTVNGVSESYSYDSADKLLTVSGGNDPRTFGYDAAGRMTSVQRAAGTTFLAYDFDDRVVQIQDPTGVQNHTYDSLDARISSTFGGVTRNYRRSGAGSWAPVVSDGTALFSPGVSERRGGTTTYLHADSGSTDLQTTAAGAALAGREFSAFGELVQSAGTWQGQSGFMGLDNFGGHFKVGNGGGVYDPGTGRVGTPGAGGRNDYTPGSGGPSNRIHPTIEFVPADEGGPYTAPWEWEDFFAGWGDTLTWGGTRQVRVWIGCDDVVDYGSGSYRVGEIVGEVHDTALGGRGKVGKTIIRVAEEGGEKAAKAGSRRPFPPIGNGAFKKTDHFHEIPIQIVDLVLKYGKRYPDATDSAYAVYKAPGYATVLKEKNDVKYWKIYEGDYEVGVSNRAGADTITHVLFRPYGTRAME